MKKIEIDNFSTLDLITLFALAFDKMQEIKKEKDERWNSGSEHLKNKTWILINILATQSMGERDTK